MSQIEDYDILVERAEILKALGHPIRLCIVKKLWEEGEKKVGDMQGCLDIPQSTVSQHLAVLKTAGIIEGTREKTEVFYKVCSERVIDLLKALF